MQRFNGTVTSEKINRKLTSLLGVIFFFSGFASLIYQVVWQRLLTLHYGVGSISITLIVSIYMGGLGIGALCGGILAERFKPRFTVYFIVELLIGCFGLSSLSLLHFLGQSTAGSGYRVAFFYMSLFLCIPTLLMGMTLPLLTKIFNSLIHNFLSTVSFLYFINTLGAAIGTVFASYVLISFVGLDAAVYCASGINFILAVLIFLARYIAVHQPQEKKQREESMSVVQDAQENIMGRIAYLLVFITGFLAIGYEIIWFRVVGALVKASPYAFSSILSIYLFGIALGSFGISRYLQRSKTVERRSLFYFLQFLIGVYVMIIFIGYYYLTQYTFVNGLTRLSFSSTLHPRFLMPSFHSIQEFLKDVYLATDVLFWPAIFVLIPTIFMGASFPLISCLALSKPNKEGKTVGTVYFFNILGNVLGGILTGLIFLPYLGTEVVLLIFSSIGICLLGGVGNLPMKRLSRVPKIVGVLALLVVNMIFFPKGGQLYAIIHSSFGNPSHVHLEEGIDGIVVSHYDPSKFLLTKASVAKLRVEGLPEKVVDHLKPLKWQEFFEENEFWDAVEKQIGRERVIQHQEQIRSHAYHPERFEVYINGLGHGRRPDYGYYYEAIEAMSFAPTVEKVLIIGFGAGSITEAILKMRDVRNITLVELSHALIKNLTRLSLFEEMLSDPRINLIIDDGRRFLLRSEDQFDLILIDPLRSTTAYSNNLYSHQFFELINRHLASGGVFMVWMNEHRVMPKTVLSVFNHVRKYTSFCLASNMPFIRNKKRQETLLLSFSPRERESILKIDAGSYLGDQVFVENLTSGYPINQDWKPICEYYLGLRVKEKYFY